VTAIEFEKFFVVERENILNYIKNARTLGKANIKSQKENLKHLFVVSESFVTEVHIKIRKRYTFKNFQ
jgi:hypothetical protein